MLMVEMKISSEELSALSQLRSTPGAFRDVFQIAPYPNRNGQMPSWKGACAAGVENHFPKVSHSSS